jgi:hypothetical protein
LQPNCDACFAKHLEVLRIALCYDKTHKVNEKEVKVHELLNAKVPNYQQGMFQLTMKSNATSCMVPPFDTNLLTYM